MEISTNSSISVVQRDKFLTDPFFLAARRTLEKYLLELSQRDSKQSELLTSLGADVHNFHPQDINVSVKDDLVEVTAQHQEHTPQHNSQLAIHKRYKMPFPLNTDMVQCSISNDGILYLIAPWLNTS
ncbi:Alpha-crystallin A chain [Frankliniella fusca]|uniref:Alpha-crystallin A chain n=1 Tax=Frankliniella fusca TaxID=407009 RepID=A0AAE1I151_9NEOP|nr:Alpha-crystallin A chain [Frankliniella fusca]